MEKSNYWQHLNYENFEKSKSYKLNKCLNILAMIARLNDRKSSLVNFAKELHGTKDGILLMKKEDIIKIEQYKKMIVRLKNYYNKNINELKKF